MQSFAENWGEPSVDFKEIWKQSSVAPSVLRVLQIIQSACLLGALTIIIIPKQEIQAYFLKGWTAILDRYWDVIASAFVSPCLDY